MNITPQSIAQRKVWSLDNDAVTVEVMEGGGHLSAVRLNEHPAINPLWKPKWKGLEPWQFQKRHAARYQIPLLAAICGHNVCFGHFGDPSPDELAAGLGTHGEAPVVRWKVSQRTLTRQGLTWVYGCRLPIAEMSFTRRIRMPRGSHVVQIRETIRNLARRDVPFGLCQHVTFGAPFVEPETTLFDMSATRGHTFPGDFGQPQRLKSDTAFVWPNGPGADGKTADLRILREQPNSDFSTQMMNPARDHAWFSAVHPGHRILVAYIWKRSDFPWLGNWEENRARTTPPWNGKELTRGMEFSTSPFPVGLRRAVTMNRFQGQPTYRWLPARGVITLDYALMVMPVDPGCKGVTDITPQEKGRYQVDLIY
jgi:hypothetical protein